MTTTETMHTEYKGIKYSADQVTDMREWLNECEFSDLERDLTGNYDLSDLEVLTGTDRHYAGGLAGFLAAY